jgi:UDP-N-acetylglucosamine diphosphorylase/glucosamine-1-phosphate N-acetyltransferase
VEIICFFEDEICKNLEPLTLTRPADDLRCGILTMSEKWTLTLDISIITRNLKDHRKEVYKTELPDEAHSFLWINPRVLPDQHISSNILLLNSGEYLVSDELVIAAKVPPETHFKWIENKPVFSSLKKLHVNRSPERFSNLWDLISMNGSEIVHDINRLGNLEPIGENSHFTITGEHGVLSDENVEIEPGVVFITNDGPIVLQDNSKIMANSVIRGPSVICRGSTVKTGAKIYKNTTIGPVCKVGGEIDNCIFHSYANKAHDGFTGNSIFGQWTNLGADTNTSNMKNNYSKIAITDFHTAEKTDTDRQFFGTVLGDHSKTAINTMLNTGTICGVSSNILSSGFPPNHIRSFTWISDKNRTTYTFEKAVETMKIMMARRNVTLTDNYIEMMKAIFESEN